MTPDRVSGPRPALDSVLRRFARKHKTQAFRFDVGSDRAGTVLRTKYKG